MTMTLRAGMAPPWPFQPQPLSSSGARRAITPAARAALRDAGVEPSSIDAPVESPIRLKQAMTIASQASPSFAGALTTPTSGGTWFGFDVRCAVASVPQRLTAVAKACARQRRASHGGTVPVKFRQPADGDWREVVIESIWLLDDAAIARQLTSGHEAADRAEAEIEIIDLSGLAPRAFPAPTAPLTVVVGTEQRRVVPGGSDAFAVEIVTLVELWVHATSATSPTQVHTLAQMVATAVGEPS